MWAAVDEITSAPVGVEALRRHGLHLIAAHARCARGEPLHPELRREQQRAAARALAAPVILRRACDAFDGPFLLMKGPEIAARYPQPTMRPYIDLDLLVDDPEGARAELLRAGFSEVGDPARYAGAHHLRPLVWPELPLPIELHRTINHPSWLRPPATAGLLACSQPSAIGVHGLRALPPGAHALVLALHGWAHEPLRRLLDLLDVAVALEGGRGRDPASELARDWGVRRLWQTTLNAVDALLYGRGDTFALRVWARHLRQLRERTVLEGHMARFAGPACGSPSHLPRALVAAAGAFTAAAGRKSEERRVDAARRTVYALADAFLAQSRHESARRSRRGRRL